MACRVTQRRIVKKKKMSYFRRFWVKEPRRSEKISEYECYLYRSMRPAEVGKGVSPLHPSLDQWYCYDRELLLFGVLHVTSTILEALHVTMVLLR